MARTPVRKQTPQRQWRGLLVRFFLVVLALGVAGIVWLDMLVLERFDAHQWKLPARVHARPVELYEGRELTRDQLERLMQLMRYREDPKAQLPGSYVVSGREWLLHTRGFSRLNGEPARRLRLVLGDGHLQRLATGQGEPLALARLEPLQIGSIHPGHREDRVLVRLEDTPEKLRDILLAVEDRHFYKHHGLSLRGLARALVANIRAGSIEEGGSTLTQQLVKNFWLTNERNVWRKLIEMPMAVLLELHYDKDEILEAYLNEVYLGQDGSRAIHGMGLASRFWFGRRTDELEPHQFALLVGLLKGPSYYDPRRHPQRALERRNTVLEVAHREGVLSEAELEEYSRRELGVVPRGESALYAFPAFMDLVRHQLAQDYPADVLSDEGLQIQSTLDVLAQIAAENALTGFFEGSDLPDPLNGAVVMTSPEQGDVLALVGNKAPRTAGFNRALGAVRPIGSLVKPAVVLAALERTGQYNLGTPVNDEPVELKMPNGSVWAPQNIDGEARGSIPLLEALTDSRNQAIARLGLDVGVADVIDVLERLGVRRKIPRYPSILLGSLELSPFEVAVMYQTLATGGFYAPLRSITDVMDRNGETLARYPMTTEAVLQEGPAHLIQWAMQQVVKRGTGRYAGERLPALQLAGKTGTSDAFRDSWFAGFSGSHLTVVWLGRDDNRQTSFTGSSGALHIWTTLTGRVPQRPLMLTPPENVREVWLDRETGALSGPGCGEVARYPVIEASIPERITACGKNENTKGILKWFQNLFR